MGVVEGVALCSGCWGEALKGDVESIGATVLKCWSAFRWIWTGEKGWDGWW